MTIARNPEDQLPAPVLPDMASEPPMVPPQEIDMEPVEADLDDPEPPKRGRPSNKAKAQAKPKVMSEDESDKWDYDSWINSFEWDQPGMQCKVERITPEMVGTVQTAGHCTTVDNTPLSTKQIQEMFGGGKYHVSVIGPRKTSKGVRIQRLSHKPLKIPGDPNLNNLGRVGQTSPADVAAARAPSQRSAPPQGSDPSMVRLVDSMIQPLQRRVDMAGQQSVQATQAVGAQYADAANMKIQAANDMLREKDQMLTTQLAGANQRVEEARREAEAARAEKEKALVEAREAQERIYRERAAMEEQFTKKLQSVQGDSSNLIATLIPSIQSQAQNQINTMMSVFEGRLASQDATYTSRLEGLERSHENRMAAAADLFRSQLESAKQLYQGQIQHLQALLQQVQSEKTLLVQQLDDARNRMMEQIAQVNKASDPEEQLVKLGGLLETVKGITGLTGGDDEKAASSGNAFFDSIMANVGKITEVVPHVTGAIAAKAQADAAMAHARNHPMGHPYNSAHVPPNQVPQQMLQAPQQQPEEEESEVMAAPQQQPVRRHVRRRPPQQQQTQQAAPKAKGKVPREELDNAVVFINSALGSNPELEPEDFANMALSSVDNDMLRRLSRQKSALVVNELETMNVLHGQVSTEAGKAWMCKLLDVLREKL